MRKFGLRLFSILTGAILSIDVSQPPQAFADQLSDVAYSNPEAFVRSLFEAERRSDAMPDKASLDQDVAENLQMEADGIDNRIGIELANCQWFGELPTDTSIEGEGEHYKLSGRAQLADYLAKTASFYAYSATQLELSGYDKKLWKSQIDALMIKQARSAANLVSKGLEDGYLYANTVRGTTLEAERALRRALTEVGYDKHGSLPISDFDNSSCGGDYTPSIFLDLAPEGKLEIIAEVFYNYCKNTGTECDLWYEVFPTLKYPLNGRYYYRASWPAQTPFVSKMFIPPDTEEDTRIVIRK